MAGNPTAVNIGIGFNVQDIAPSRGQIASFMRDVKASITDVERFAEKVKIGESLLKKGDVSQAEFDRVIAMHREKYGIIDQGEKRVAEYHAHKQAMAKREEDSMLFLMRLRQEGRKMDEEAHAKKMADIAAEKKAEEDAVIFLMNLNKNRIAMEQEKHAKQMADVAAEKKAEEDSLVFLMQLRKQIQINEEQAHAKKMAAIAAEKKANESLGLSTYAGSVTPRQRVEDRNIDVITGKVIEQKKEILNIDEAISKLENEHQADIRRHAEENAAREKQRTQDAKAFHDQELNARKAQLKQEFDIRKAQQESRREKIRAKVDSDMGKVRFMLDQLTTSQQRYNQQLELIERMHRQERISIEQKSALLKKIKKDLDDANAAENKKSGLAGFLNRGVGGIAGGMLAGFGTAAIGSKISDFISSSITTAIERERITMAIGALTGSAQTADKLTSAFRTLDKQSALSFMEISKGAQTMLGFGVSTELVMPSLKALSQISMGNADRFQSLSLAFGQVAASGKLAGQEILQMVNAGFNPLQEISRRTGRTMSDLKAAVEAGEVSFSMVADALLSASEAGGRFAGMDEAFLETLGGQISKFKSDIEIMKAQFGEELFPSLKTMIDTLSENKDVLSDVTSIFRALFDAAGAFAAMYKDFKPKTVDEGIDSFLKNTVMNIAGGSFLSTAATALKGNMNNTSELSGFFNKLDERDRDAKQRELEIANKSKDGLPLTMSEEERNAAIKTQENEKRLSTLRANTDKIAAKIEEDRKKETMSKRDLLIQELDINNRVFDQQQRQKALQTLAAFDASQAISEQKKRAEEMKKMLEDSKTAAEKLQEQISFVNEAQKNGLISAIDAKKILDNLNDEANKKDRDGQERRRNQWQEFARSIDKQADAVERVKDIMLAVEYGFLDAAAAAKAKLEVARDIAKDDQVAMENPRALDLGQALIQSQRAQKAQTNEMKMINHLQSIEKFAQQQVNILKQQPGFAERN